MSCPYHGKQPRASCPNCTGPGPGYPGRSVVLANRELIIELEPGVLVNPRRTDDPMTYTRSVPPDRCTVCWVLDNGEDKDTNELGACCHSRLPHFVDWVGGPDDRNDSYATFPAACLEGWGHGGPCQLVRVILHTMTGEWVSLISELEGNEPHRAELGGYLDVLDETYIRATEAGLELPVNI